MKSNKFWILIFAAVLTISSGAAAIIALKRPDVGKARIIQDGVLIQSIDLSSTYESRSITLENGTGFNVINIEHGRLRVSQANCPDEYCVRQGWASGGAIPIVCLPHRLVIRFDPDTQSDDAPHIDAVVG